MLSKLLKKVNLIDSIHKWRLVIFPCISVGVSYMYCNSDTVSIRESVSDIVSVSSIILGILGVFISIVALLEDSDFVKSLNDYAGLQKNKFDVFKYLLLFVKRQFILNVCFIFLTVMIKFAPGSLNIYIRIICLSIWGTLFLLTFWGVYYIINIIINIQLQNYNIRNSVGKHRRKYRK